MTTGKQPVRRKPSLVSATLVLFAVLALIGLAVFVPHASAGRPANSGSAPASVVTVVIREFKFVPETVIVRGGESVEWKNDDIVLHTATADGESQRPAFDSGTIQTGAAWRYIAPKKGTYDYTCTLHPNMKGKLIVR